MSCFEISYLWAYSEVIAILVQYSKANKCHKANATNAGLRILNTKIYLMIKASLLTLLIIPFTHRKVIIIGK